MIYLLVQSRAEAKGLRVQSEPRKRRAPRSSEPERKRRGLRVRWHGQTALPFVCACWAMLPYELVRQDAPTSPLAPPLQHCFTPRRSNPDFLASTPISESGGTSRRRRARCPAPPQPRYRFREAAVVILDHQSASPPAGQRRVQRRPVERQRVRINHRRLDILPASCFAASSATCTYTPRRRSPGRRLAQHIDPPSLNSVPSLYSTGMSTGCVRM